MALVRTRFGNLFGRRSESGTAAIEFALFTPFLLILLTGTVELGFLMYEAMQVNNAVEAGILYAAANTTFNATNVNNAAVNASVLPTGLNTLAATSTQYCGCPTAAGVTNLGTQPPCSATACSGLQAGTYVQVNASLTHTIIIPNPWVPATLNATAVIRTN
jgi:Flp pilus assembly protein TadG